jgi:uncharacterized membrane protein
LQLEVSISIERPVATVWDFYAVHHVENHPRWDPDLELEKVTDGSIGVGTVIRRRSVRFGTPTEGTMEIVAFEPERLMWVETRDGDMTIHGRARFADLGGGRTELRIGGDFVGMDDSMEETIRPLMERSLATIKDLIESET